MPIRNEERHLEEAVRRVLSQDYPGEIEVILAVGPSRDKTMDIAERISSADSRITVIPNPSGEISSALNAAIKASRHSVIARVDGHALLPPGYLRTALRVMAETGADDVGGVMAAAGTSSFEQAVAWAMTSPFGVGAARFHTGGQAGPVDSAYLGVYRRAAIERVGGYDEAFLVAEDWELNHRIAASGGLIWFQPELRVTYRPRASVRALGRQYFRYGRWRRAVARQHVGTISPRYLAPPAAVLAMAAGIAAAAAGLAVGGALRWLAVGLAIPVTYLAGILVVTGMAARTVAPSALIRLPAALATMHLCWGLGFLTSPRRLMPGPCGRIADSA
jgi:cellulose synthase/poly-beta-1,6-N-acetylglucosamine synthase-like glycosyltransferase